MLVPQRIKTSPVLGDNFLRQLCVHAHKQQVSWCARVRAMQGSG